MQTLRDVLGRKDEREHLKLGAWIILATVLIVTIVLVLGHGPFMGLGERGRGVDTTTVSSEATD